MCFVVLARFAARLGRRVFAPPREVEVGVSAPDAGNEGGGGAGGVVTFLAIIRDVSSDSAAACEPEPCRC